MKLLLVEDDDFKFDRIEGVIKQAILRPNITRKDNVSNTVLYLQNNKPSRIILDMSLPTHAVLLGQGSPQPMPMGGIEILFEIRRLSYQSVPILILTQYPDFEIEGESVLIEDASTKIKNVLSLPFVSAVYYEDQTSDWENKVVHFLRG